jgi:hypothetical protein
MTCGLDMHVSMSWVKLDNLLVGYIGMRIFIKKKKKKKKKREEKLIIDKLFTE